MKKKRNAFTLLEMVIVFIIMSVLVSLAMVRYVRVIEKARGAEANDILVKCYAGYQRMVFDGESCPGGSTPCWSKWGMSDPNALANRYFDYSVTNNWANPTGMNATSRTDSSKWLWIDFNSGVITRTSPY